MHNLFSFNRKRNGKNGEKITKAIPYKLKFIDSISFMTSSLSNHVNNLPKGIHKTEWKHGYLNKKCRLCEIKYKDCECVNKVIRWFNSIQMFIFVTGITKKSLTET